MSELKRNIIVVVAYDINYKLGSESEFAFSWVEILEKYYDIILHTEDKHREDLIER